MTFSSVLFIDLCPARIVVGGLPLLVFPSFFEGVVRSLPFETVDSVLGLGRCEVGPPRACSSFKEFFQPPRVAP